MGKKHKTQALTPARTSERISILKMQVFMLIATFLLLGQTKGRKPLGLSSLTNETGLVAELEKFVTEVESKLWVLQTSVVGINQKVDDISENATALQTSVEGIDERVDDINEEVDDIKDNATALQTSVDDINEKVNDIKDNAKINNECCDKKDDDKCEKYRGTMNVGRDGNTCKLWEDTSYKPASYKDAGLEENYCRNPGPYAHEGLPWCYYEGGWSYCDVPMC